MKVRTAFNIFAVQAGWFACVLSAAAGKPWIGVGVSAAGWIVHLAWIRPGLREALLLASAAAIGLAADSGVASLGAIRFAPPEPVAPAWMAALWANFAATLRVSMSWLQGRWILSALLGAVAGPLSYLAGQRLGAIAVDNPWAVAVEWALAMPALFLLAKVLP